MITENNIKRLENIVAHFAMEDYKRANPKKKIDRKTGLTIHNPYSLSPQTNEAREILKLSRKENISQDEEETVKAYLLKMKMINNL